MNSGLSMYWWLRSISRWRPTAAYANDAKHPPVLGPSPAPFSEKRHFEPRLASLRKAFSTWARVTFEAAPTGEAATIEIESRPMRTASRRIRTGDLLGGALLGTVSLQASNAPRTGCTGYATGSPVRVNGLSAN